MVTRRKFNQYVLALVSTLLHENDTLAKPSSENILTRAIPSSGLLMPVIGMGTWITFDINEGIDKLKNQVAILESFFQNGGQMIDSSPMYGYAQKALGLTLELTNNNHNLFSATKVWTYGKKNGLKQIEESMRLWKLESLDLMYVHNMVDWKTHLPTLSELKKQSKIKYIGVTTSHGRRHRDLINMIKNNPIDFIQITYNIQDREVEEYLLPLAQDLGIAVVINRPFQTGCLFSRIKTKPLPKWANDIQCKTWAQFFLKFIVSHPAVTCAIPATTQVMHMHENMQAIKGNFPDENMRKEMVKYYQSVVK